MRRGAYTLAFGRCIMAKPEARIRRGHAMIQEYRAGIIREYPGENWTYGTVIGDVPSRNQARP
jgi:hypothetical protein